MSGNAMIYCSVNRDVWRLVPDTERNRLRIRYEPERGAGGSVELVAFLSEDHGPQHEALPRLLQDIPLT